MIKFINSWAQGIILAVIIATIIEIILPEGNNKKYVKTVIGIYIMFSILHPLITKISNKSINLNSIINSTTKEINKYDDNNLIAIETNIYIEDTYKKKIEEDLKEKIEEKGYRISNLNLYIETEDEGRYGQINTMVMNLTKISKEQIITNNVNEIKKVDINISNTNTLKEEKKSNDVSQEEIKNIKEFLYNTYSVEIEKIHINE